MKRGELEIKNSNATNVNKSHAACYSYISILTAYFKAYYPAKFMASLLTMQDNQDKIEQYIRVARKMGIKISAPDINISNINFTENNGEILFGLGSIKGVGETSIPSIINNRPYQSLQDAINKIEKKSLNKRVGLALIKSGAFDFYNSNRNEVINEFYTLRKDKEELLDINSYNETICNEYEKEVLSTTVTNVPFWETIMANENVQVEFTITNIREKIDKNNKLMAFLKGEILGCEIEAIIFSHIYTKNIGKIMIGNIITLKGIKDDKGKLIINSVK